MRFAGLHVRWILTGERGRPGWNEPSPFTKRFKGTWKGCSGKRNEGLKMSSSPEIVALNVEANIYMLVDGKGHSLGTGTREVCEVLAQIATVKDVPCDASSSQPRARSSNGNIRSAIAI